MRLDRMEWESGERGEECAWKGGGEARKEKWREL